MFAAMVSDKAHVSVIPGNSAVVVEFSCVRRAVGPEYRFSQA